MISDRAAQQLTDFMLWNVEHGTLKIPCIKCQAETFVEQDLTEGVFRLCCSSGECGFLHPWMPHQDGEYEIEIERLQ